MSSPATLKRSLLNIEETLGKVAAAVADKRQAEQAFAEQVYTLMVNRAGPLMEQQHRLGFEVVHANDDFTEMFGIWAFRLDPNDSKKLVYVPCFFRGGRVMADSIYNVHTRQMRPLTPAWCKEIIENSSKQDGHGVPRHLSSKFRPNIRFNRILLGGSSSVKRASGRTDEQLTAELNDMAAQIAEPERLLPGLARELGGEKIAKVLIEMSAESEKFASRIHKIMDKWDDAFVPSAAKPTKQATARDQVTLRLFTRNTVGAICSLKPEQRTKVAAAVQSKGYWFDADTTANDKNIEFSRVYDASHDSNCFVEVTEPGIYNVLLVDGSLTKCLVARGAELWTLQDASLHPDVVMARMARSDEDGNTPVFSYGDSSVRNNRAVFHAVDLEGKRYWSGRQEVYTPQQDRQSHGELMSAADVEEGKSYCFYNPKLRRMTDPQNVEKVVKADGVVTIHFGYSHVTINPNQDEAVSYGTLGKDWRAIEVKRSTVESSTDNCSPLCAPTSRSVVDNFLPMNASGLTKLLTQGVPLSKKASIKYLGEDCFELMVDGRTSPAQGELANLVKLAGHLAIAPATAEAMLDAARERGTAHFGILPPEKLAGAMLTVVDSPQWLTSYDSVLQVEVQEPQEFILRTQRQPLMVPAMRIGDVYRDGISGTNPKEADDGPPTGAKNVKDDASVEIPWKRPVNPRSIINVKSAAAPDEMLLSASPEQLAQFAETSQESVLDHGILGSMAHVSDIEIYLQQYITKIEEGLNYIGRCLFLLRVKPQEWARLYGTDDLMEAEDRLVSTYRTLGELVLFLNRRNANPRDESDVKGKS